MSACPHLGGGMGKIDMRGIGKDLRGSLHYFRFSERRVNNLGSFQAAEEAPNRLTGQYPPNRARACRWGGRMRYSNWEACRKNIGLTACRSMRSLWDLTSLIIKTILVSMTTVSISELKANLSRYVREVRRGGEVQVLDRGTPVARLVPLATEDNRGVRERLISQGILRPGKAGAGAILDEPLLTLPVSISEALAEDRNDRL